jgi:peptide/nickel transport system substrate-binding protein
VNGRAGRRLAAALLLGAVTFGVASCAGDRPPRVGGTAVVVYAGSPRAANPLVAADAYSAEMNRFLLFLPLLQHGPRLELEPRLAESWEVEGDSAAVFRLRRGILWSDGVESSAADVVFTLERALDPATGYPNRADLDHVEEVVAVDSFTVRVRFRPVRDPIDPVGLLPVLPRHALAGLGPTELLHAEFNLRPVTNGPFRVVEARPSERWVFAANEAFPEALGGRPRLDRLIWRQVAESSSQVAELMAGEADVVVGVRHDALERVSGQGVRLLERPTLSYVTVAWNGRRPPLNDARVRRALTLAMDRDVIVEALRGGHGRVAAGPVPPGHWASSSRTDPLPHDPDAARSLLEEAGYGSESPLRLTLLLPAGSDFNRDLAQVVQADLARVGVRVQLRALEFATLIQTITGPSRDFDAVLLALDADPRLDLRSLFHSDALDGPFQVAGYSNVALDSVLTAIEMQTDRRAALPLWERAQELVAHDQPWSFLYYLTDLVLVRSRIHGVQPDLRGVLHSAAQWWVD